MANAAEAAAILPELLQPGDVILVKGSRGVGLELVCQRPEHAMPELQPDGIDLRPGADCGDGVAAVVPVPQPEVHRLHPAQPVRPEHSRGGASGPPREGRDAHPRRDRHLPRFRHPVPDPVDAGLEVAGRVRRSGGLCTARVRRRLHEDRQAPFAGSAGTYQAGGDDRDLARAVVGGDPGSAGIPSTRQTSVRRRDDRSRAPVSRVHLLRRRRARPVRSTSPTGSTVSPPGAPRSCCWPTSGSPSSPPASET